MRFFFLRCPGSFDYFLHQCLRTYPLIAANQNETIMGGVNMENALVLLIGSNNIPNYVTAKYLLNPERKDTKELPVPEKLVLVFSEETKKFRDSLVDSLGIGFEKIVDVHLGSDERKHSVIKQLLKQKLEANDPSISSVHLNYTGGTKAMVLAAYDAVESFCEGGKGKLYSYLDPENFKLTMNEDSQFPLRDDLRSFVKPRISEIFKLHCIDAGSHEPKKETTREYEQFASRDGFFARVAGKDFQDALATFENKLKEPKKKYFKEEHVAIFHNLLRTENIIDCNESPNLSECQKVYSLVAFDWLEQAVFSALRSIQSKEDTYKLDEILWNVKGFFADRDFEIDVMALRGYQMFVFSCTSDDNLRVCKQKAFEVNYRAVQMGGEHAKSVLVCLGDNSNSKDPCIDGIEKDMAQFEAAQNFSIIGREHLLDRKKLEDKIRAILRK